MSTGYIQEKEYGPGRSVSNNQSSLVTLNEMAIKAGKNKYSVSSIDGWCL